ncbi:MAG: S41 family peptidase [Ignavibacteriaceae bacterium]
MKNFILFFTVCLLFTFDLNAQEEITRLLRFPDISEDQIAFVYAGDIWIVNSEGGTAKRLTSHEGLELSPKFSPDGRWIAFSGEYSGNRQVYVISVDGGNPRQLTFYNDVGPMPPRGGYDYRILGWTPDGKNILFRGNRLPWGERMGKYFLIPFEGGFETPLQIPEGGGGDLSPDGTKMVYTPIDREFRTWKRYRGGRAQDIWIYDLVNNSSERLTDFVGTDNQPLWVRDKIYFTSDRDFTLNLYSIDPLTKEIKKETAHDDFDVLWPAKGGDKIVYECGGYIYKFDTQTGKTAKVPIKVFGDFQSTVPYFKNVRENIETFNISSTGKRAVFEARGDIFTVPAEKGEIKNITSTPGIREIFPAWSPDGKWICYLSDRSGEYEIYIIRSDGSGEERRITNDGKVWRFQPVWSPDSKKIAFSDKTHSLYYTDIETGTTVKADESQYEDITDYSWSPDSKWLAYTKSNNNELPGIWLYSIKSGEARLLTDDFTINYNPVFDPDGKYIYFLSNRDFNLKFSSWEFDYLYTDPTRVYAASLNDEIPLLFSPESDEELINDTKNEDPDREKVNDKSDKDLKIQFENFEKRIAVLPGPSGVYSSLGAVKNGIIYFFRDGSEFKLKMFDTESEKEEVLLEAVGSYAISADEKKLLYRKNGEFGIVDLKPDQKNTDGRLNLDKLEMKIVPKAEWQQMFTDGWRLLRDWFYDPEMHGLDWQQMKDKYEPLVKFVSHRADLDYIFGELGGELNAGHVYVNSGDQPKVNRIDNGLLGAELAPDESGYYRIQKIFPGENWHDNFRSPLTEFGVDINEGDYIIAVDGEEIKFPVNFYKSLENKAGKLVTLLVNDKPTTEGAREELIKPVASETNLRYLDWVESRRNLVDELSGGRIGYIHVPNTSFEGNRELYKYLVPQIKKDALIIDDRYNGGGFIPDRMIEWLDRPILNYWVSRGLKPNQTPGLSHQGPKAMLINGLSSSGGDAFPYYFRKRNLGTIIGTRTWGGLIGISGNPGLMDGGSISIPTFRFLDTNGKWAVENEGVAPDIEVIDRPELVAQGRDPSIEKAVEILLEELKKNPPDEIKVPPAPRQEK